MDDTMEGEVVFGDNGILNIMYLRCLWDIQVKITAWWSDEMSKQGERLDNDKPAITTTT